MLFKGSDNSKRIDLIINYIKVYNTLAGMIRTTLGLHKLSILISYCGNISAISNDGVTIVKLLNPAEPIAGTLMDSVLFLYQGL
ncbi:MAG: hypothetical protein EZS28_003630 [Streblomastix strix]|uniref:Uncharacterized protein n=1 Tax=Streblomastix strix TaxID=222440 RepID=A0A5J4X2F0_9EUKA|nr:MAG: hypothetical protein EZS28_003630 [Streblomastix strix]